MCVWCVYMCMHMCMCMYVCVQAHTHTHLCAYRYMANKDLERTIENTKTNDREESSTVNFVRKECSCY